VRRRPPTLAGRRVLVRMAAPAEAPAVAAYFARNRRHLAPFEPDRPPGFHSPAAWRRRLEASRSAFERDQELRLFVFERSAPREVIGTISFSGIARGPFQACNLGFSLDGGRVGRGLMAEALRLALAHAFAPGGLALHRVQASHLPRNLRSARLLARLGFRVEGRARRYLRIAGAWRDHVLTSKTAPGR
jgi:ribosomal-protein-alanine N-acetyltransferase